MEVEINKIEKTNSKTSIFENIDENDKNLLNRNERYWLKTLRRKELLKYKSNNLNVQDDNKKVHIFYLWISKVTGMLIPANMENVPRENIAYRIQISFFDINNRCFFGRTSVDYSFQLNNDRDNITLKNRPFVYYTSIKSDKCIGIVEYVVLEKKDDIILRQYSVGWTTLNLFNVSIKSLKDVSDKYVILDKKRFNTTTNMNNISSKQRYKTQPIVRYFYRGSPYSFIIY